MNVHTFSTVRREMHVSRVEIFVGSPFELAFVGTLWRAPKGDTTFGYIRLNPDINCSQVGQTVKACEGWGCVGARKPRNPETATTAKRERWPWTLLAARHLTFCGRQKCTAVISASFRISHPLHVLEVCPTRICTPMYSFGVKTCLISMVKMCIPRWRIGLIC